MRLKYLSVNHRMFCSAILFQLIHNEDGAAEVPVNLKMTCFVGIIGIGSLWYQTKDQNLKKKG